MYGKDESVIHNILFNVRAGKNCNEKNKQNLYITTYIELLKPIVNAQGCEYTSYKELFKSSS